MRAKCWLASSSVNDSPPSMPLSASMHSTAGRSSSQASRISTWLIAKYYTLGLLFASPLFRQLPPVGVFRPLHRAPVAVGIHEALGVVRRARRIFPVHLILRCVRRQKDVANQRLLPLEGPGVVFRDSRIALVPQQFHAWVDRAHVCDEHAIVLPAFIDGEPIRHASPGVPGMEIRRKFHSAQDKLLSIADALVHFDRRVTVL